MALGSNRWRPTDGSRRTLPVRVGVCGGCISVLRAGRRAAATLVGAGQSSSSAGSAWLMIAMTFRLALWKAWPLLVP